MANDLIKIIDATTGEEVEREMTDEEQASRDAEVTAYLAEKAKKEEENLKAESDKSSAAAKLAALGLTIDDLKAIGL
jgi:exopolyphosphatase/pppGpp-phosphohydrolase